MTLTQKEIADVLGKEFKLSVRESQAAHQLIQQRPIFLDHPDLARHKIDPFHCQQIINVKRSGYVRKFERKADPVVGIMRG